MLMLRMNWLKIYTQD